MPATPAWPPQSTPRLFVDTPLSPGPLPVDGPAAHYLAGVMRLKIGDPVKLFDDRTGEWLATAASVGKRDLVLDVTERLREREAVPDLWLCAAPIKKGRVDWLAEKACELGVDRLVPVVTRRTVVDKPNTDRLRTHMIEAAEQCRPHPVLRRRNRRRVRVGDDACACRSRSDPDRPRRRFRRRRARGDSRASPGGRHRARPAYPPRGNRSGGGGRAVDGRSGRLGGRTARPDTRRVTLLPTGPNPL
jgi:hypothetical protein